MRPKGPAAELERRRRRAVDLVNQGESPTLVARILGVRPTTIHRWRRLARQPHGLDAKPLPGPTPRLSDRQLGRLEQLLLRGAKSHGWHNELWTADRVARLIREHFGVSYHPEHVRKILKGRLHWTRPASATTRRSNAGRLMSYPASSAKPGSARRMSCSSTNPASA
jgi:transposase